MKKKIIGTLLIISTALMMGGCGASMPELTDEEYAMIAEYAAGKVMKYNKLNKGRIVNDDVIEAQLAKEEQFRQNTQEYLEKVRKEEKEEESQEGKGSASKTSQNESIASADIASFIGMAPVTVTYSGMEICDSYPQSSVEEYYFAMDATEGKKLVVLKFAMSNASGEDAEVDVLESGTGFWVSFNGQEAESILATMLMNDFATYKGVIPSGETVEAVLVLERDAAETDEISSVGLIMRNDNGTAKTVLQ
ncbi:MAG: hypothetical protein GX234_10400 [Clostridiales bacterium]|nr:hypothetical protein [Clostridiales bacterium]